MIVLYMREMQPSYRTYPPITNTASAASSVLMAALVTNNYLAQNGKGQSQ